MGCVQARPSMDDPPPGLDRMKADAGYVRARWKTKDPARNDGGAGGAAEGPSMAAAVSNGGEGEEGRAIGAAGEGEVGNVSRRMGDARQIAEGEVETVDGWPRWLLENVQLEALAGLVPKSAECYDMLRKVGQGTYSNVYKARDRDTGKIVALKKVRFETSESESVKFMAREILILRKLDHPNVMKLEGLATSRMHRSIYLVFDFMQSDLARVVSRSDGRLTEPQVKCYMQQLLSGLQHCHEKGILHRDIKGSNLLIDKNGVLKIADFGLANNYDPRSKRPLTSRVVTLWYRAPELLLGATDYGVGIDLWSAGCLLAEMFAGRPILPGRTELEQLHRIFRLCGSPSEDYWKKLRIATSFRPPHSNKPSFAETFRDFPASSLGLLSTLLALDPAYRGSASSALQNEFFSMSPLACELSGLPVIYTEDINEVDQSREHRKRKSSRKKRAGAQREGQKKDNQASEKPKGDSGSSKEEKSSDAMTNSGDLNSSSTGSTSSGAKPIIKFPTFQQSAKIENLLEHVKNTKNSPSSPSVMFRSLSDVEDDEITHRPTLEKRSASTVDFCYLVGEMISEHYTFGK